MDELLEQFLIEGRELVAQASKDIAALDRDPRDGAAIDSAFRAIHTLKGSFAIFALAPAERLLHGAEDVLEQARKGAATLAPALLAGLTACLDQTDRWIDAMAQSGALPEDADTRSREVLARLSGDRTEHKAEHRAEHRAEPIVAPPEPSNWLAALIEREAGVIERHDTPLTAFRYRPDADCFFRGDDPLAVVEGVEGLVALAILPVGGAWPAADTIDPFACLSILEGLSTADEPALRAAFRLQPDQVEVAAIPRAPGTREPTPRDAVLLRVDAARIDGLADGFRDLVVAVNALAPLADDIERLDRSLAQRLRGAHAGIERVAGLLHGHLAQIRLVSLEGALRRLPRAAREIAEGLGKEITFLLEGETIEADKQIAEGLFEPLLHLVRNAIDHGIEMPEMRRRAGKPAQGRLHLTLARDGEAITATFSDDGAGIDPAAIRRTAIARGLLDSDAEVSADAALQLIFAPGFSTAANVTDLSGRGVGMDAVRMAVTRLRGTIEVDSTPGAGTRFHMRFPAHALTTPLLVVEVAGQRFGLPLEQVVETLRIAASAIKPLGRGQACVLRGSTVPVIDLASLLGLPALDEPTARLVITRADGHPAALRVSAILHRVETVLRPHRGVLAQAHGLLGSVLLGDGSVLLVLDLRELLA